MYLQSLLQPKSRWVEVSVSRKGVRQTLALAASYICWTMVSVGEAHQLAHLWLHSLLCLGPSWPTQSECWLDAEVVAEWLNKHPHPFLCVLLTLFHAESEIPSIIVLFVVFINWSRTLFILGNFSFIFFWHTLVCVCGVVTPPSPHSLLSLYRIL